MRRGWIASPRGASDGDRTRDPLLGRQMLYQLSYTGVLPGLRRARFIYLLLDINLLLDLA